ncbi:hypothetical protein SKAU_G00353490 [Synaphobranchus kaupii]|uniref:DUF4371 domain-containing protein n=1 Tax=Synaphobranchus kaupii TaxID=118154 RepID=A0A9Q1EKY6_SYNKA|nr:hypothetical protein SKAU_G00353490 [Synaphobranchus kaupii]
MKIEAVKDHESSKSHIQAQATKKARAGVPEESVAVRALVSMKTAQFERLKMLFRNVHAIGKSGRPFSDYMWMCKVDDQKGLEIGSTYRNANQAKTFIHYIAEVERKRLKEKIAATKYISIMSDGSTDAVMEEELVYLRSCQAGKVEAQFVGIQAVEKADAHHITEAICTIMDSVTGGSSKEGATDDYHWMEKLVACATDGAAVMTGAKRGVVSQLRGRKAYIVGVHCMAHRPELAYADAIRGNTLSKKVEELLSGLYVFYHKSCLNRANLKKSFAAVELNVLMPTRIGGTRWVSHLLRTSDQFLRGYKGIAHHLEEIQSPDSEGVNEVQRSKARGFLRIMKDQDVLRFSCFLHDVLTHLANLSTILQKTTVTVD